MIRATIQVTSAEELIKAYEIIKDCSSFNIIRVKNKLKGEPI